MIVELFADDEAAAEHDASPAVAVLLARFADALLTDPQVDLIAARNTARQSKGKPL